MTTGRSVLSGGVWSAASKLLPQIYTVVISIVAARYLGPTGMGQQSFIAFAEVSVVMLCTGGLPVAVMRYVGKLTGAQRPDHVRAVLRWAWRVESVGALLGAAALLAVALTRSELRSAWLWAAFVAALSILHNVPSAALAGIQQWRQISVVGIVTGLMSVGGVILVLGAGGGITGMFAVEAAISAGNLAWTSRLAGRALRDFPRRRLDPEIRRAVAGYGAVTSVNVLFAYVVWSRSEFFFLQRYSAAAEIAQYSIAFGAVTALLRLSDAAAGVLTPAVATLAGAGQHDRIRAGVSRAFRLVLHLSLAGSAAGLVLGPPAIRLAYGQDYHRAGTVLLVLLAAFPLLPVCTLAGAIATGLGRIAIALIPSAVGTGANLVLDVALIPHLGAVGAAAANTGAQLIAGVPVLLYVSRTVGNVHWKGAAVVRSALLAAGAGLAARSAVAGFSGASGLLAGSIAGLGAYIALAAVLRPLAREDAEWLADTVRSRLGAGPARVVRRAGQA